MFGVVVDTLPDDRAQLIHSYEDRRNANFVFCGQLPTTIRVDRNAIRDIGSPVSNGVGRASADHEYGDSGVVASHTPEEWLQTFAGFARERRKH